MSRFPSTSAVAFIEAKARLLRQAQQRPDTFADAVGDFNAAVDAYCNAADVPRGAHVLSCHQPLLAGLTPPLASPAHDFLQFDGSWLADAERERELPAGSEEEDNPHILQKRDELRLARKRLADLTRDGCPSVGIGRTPPFALIRADADRMGKLSSAVVRTGGLKAATALSEVLGRSALPTAVDAIEGDESNPGCMGKVIFAGGDELIALVPAAHALKAALAVSTAYETAGREWGLTCSVAVVVAATHGPLRIAIDTLTALLDDAKQHRRDEPWPNGETERTRRALGLAVIPGSGNIKRGVVGLNVPCFDDTGGVTGSRSVLADVLIPLAETLTWQDAGILVSAKLYREWLEMFEGVTAADLETLVAAGPAEGVVLAEFLRLARRHIDVSEERGQARLSPWLEQTLHTRLGSAFSTNASALKEALARDLTDRLKSLVLAGSYEGGNRSRQASAWSDLRGLLLGITTLGTREID